MGKDNIPLAGTTLRLNQPSSTGPFSEYQQPERITPSTWFAQKFPNCAAFGSPFLECEYQLPNGLTRITPISLNTDFFAAILGGSSRLKHKVIFYGPSHQFLFFDPRTQQFRETTKDKLKLLLSQLLLQCAREMPQNIDILNLFIHFRADHVLNKCIKKAKSVLAANESFFKNSPYPREPRKHEKLATLFSKTAIEHCPTAILTVNQCYQSFSLFCLSNGAEVINRHDFNGVMKNAIRREFKLGLRHDVRPKPQAPPAKGWKGLRQREGKAVVENEGDLGGAVAVLEKQN